MLGVGTSEDCRYHAMVPMAAGWVRSCQRGGFGDSRNTVPRPQVQVQGKVTALSHMAAPWLGTRGRCSASPRVAEMGFNTPKGGVLVFIYSAAHCIHSTLSISIT